MGDTVWYLNSAEGPVGPYAPVDLRQMKAAGHITDEWYVWREGLAEWQRLGDVAELQAQPTASPAAPAPPSRPAPAAQPAQAAQASSPQSGANVLKAAAARGPQAARPAAAAQPAQPAQPVQPAAATAAPAPTAPAPSVEAEPEPIIIRAPSKGKQALNSLGRIGAILLVVAAVGGGVGYYLYGDELFVMLGLVEPPPPPAPPVSQVSPEEQQAKRAYMEYQKALEAGDRDKLGELLNADRALLLEDTAVDLVAALRAARPADPAVIAGADPTPEAVTLVLKAPAPDGGKLDGMATVILEEGSWRVAGETWQLPAPDTAALEAALFGEGLDGAGLAAIAKETVPFPALGPESDILRLVVGAEGSTDLSDSRKAVLEFRSGVGAGARRLEIAFDASKKGRQRIDGQQASLSFIASDAQVWAPDGEGTLEVVQPFTGAADGTTKVIVRRLTLSSGGSSIPVSITIDISGSLAPRAGAATGEGAPPATGGEGDTAAP